MTDMSLTCEYIGLILTAILALFFRDPTQQPSPRRRLYASCLAICAISIVLNCCTVYLAPHASSIPDFIDLGVNTLYFLSSVTMTICIGQYLTYRIFEHNIDSVARRHTKMVQRAIFYFYVVLCLANLFTGWLFYFDENQVYTRGPLNSIGYAVAVAEVLIVFVSYQSNHVHTTKAVANVIKIVPPIALLLVGFQLLYPNELMNGIIGAIANFVIFVNFQSCRVEVDQLTELSNRQSFATELAYRLEDAHGKDLQVILIGLRHFTQVNKTYGHSGGDMILHAIGPALSQALAHGHAFRFGGAEFAIIRPMESEGDAAEAIRRIQRCMRRNWQVGEYQVKVDCAVVEYVYERSHPRTVEEVISRLEYALEYAKERDLAVVRYESEVSASFHRHIELIHEVETAIDENRFEVWYQPVYNHTSDCFTGAEALLRMRGEDGKIVPPNEFIPIVENSELIDDVSWVVVKDVCKLLSSGRIPELEYVSVNFTARQLLEHDFAAKLTDVISEYGVAPKQIKIEVTERTVTENGELVADVMYEMGLRGFEFMMDDFGTGYSNLSSILNMPFSFVKLDKSLMDGLDTDPRARLMASQLIELFHKMGHTVVTEGIETAGQAELAIGYGADRVQGYYFARPMDEGSLVAWYAQNAQGVAEA